MSTEAAKVSFFKSRFFAGMLGFVLGFAAAISFFGFSLWNFISPFHFSLQTSSQKHQSTPFQDFTNPPNAVNPADPFLQMQKMQQQVLNQMMQSQLGLEDLQVDQHEDEKFVYLNIKVPGLETENLNIEVREQSITIDGMVHAVGEDNSEVRESFHRQFPAPDQVDTKRVEIIHENEEIILKFPKS